MQMMSIRFGLRATYVYNQFVVVAHLFAVATMVDPRFRGKLFTVGQLPKVVEWLIEDANTALQSAPVSLPSAKRARVDQTPACSLLNELDLLLGTSQPINSSPAQQQVSAYLQQDPIPLASSPLAWWAENESNFPASLWWLGVI